MTVKEVKNSKEVKEYHQLQTAVYNWMLGELQGLRPATFDVVLREGEGEVSVEYESVVGQMDRLLTQWRVIRDGENQMEPLGYDSTISPWRKYANQLIHDCRDITLLPGVGVKTAVEWRALGINTLDDILAAEPDGDRHALSSLTDRSASRLVAGIISLLTAQVKI
jgi:predicted RecB family nuclease